jgi:type I restriction enzyme S subunit
MKQSGMDWLGEMPSHWEFGALKRYWSVTDCKHITAEFVDEGIALASIREVQGRWINLEGAKHTTQTFFELLIEGDRRPSPGDLVFSRNATVGEVAQVPDNAPPFAMGQDVCLLRRLEERYSSDYFQYVLRSGMVAEQLELLMVGSTFKRVNVEEIRALHVAVPPVPEQKAIATFLNLETDRCDVMIGEAETAIRLLRERRAAITSAAVTGKIDVGGLTDASAEAHEPPH